MQIKLGDVYNFSYNAEWSKKIFDPRWCFDGQLIVKQDGEGELYLQDTYWGWDDNEGKYFTLIEALNRGELTFVCNLNEVEKCNKRDMCYYADEDIFDLSYQHGCYENYYKKKNAVISHDKMEQVLKDKIEILEREIEYKKSDLKWRKEQLEQLQSGNTNIIL
jgi:hypothetical protein